jgi:hypothetical protein
VIDRVPAGLDRAADRPGVSGAGARVRTEAGPAASAQTSAGTVTTEAVGSGKTVTRVEPTPETEQVAFFTDPIVYFFVAAGETVRVRSVAVTVSTSPSDQVSV